MLRKIPNQIRAVNILPASSSRIFFLLISFSRSSSHFGHFFGTCIMG